MKAVLVEKMECEPRILVFAVEFESTSDLSEEVEETTSADTQA